VKRCSTTVVLALGNDILGDDGIGFHAARHIRSQSLDGVDVVETGEAGLALLDHLEGYDRALILDAIATGQCRPGTVLSWQRKDFKDIVSPSPHFSGLPELMNLAERVGMHFPKDIRVLAMEVDDPTVFRETLTPEAQKALPELVMRARSVLTEEWSHSSGRQGS